MSHRPAMVSSAAPALYPSRVRAALFCLVFLLPPWPALAQLAGVWEVVEYDPLMPENDFFGQFRYRLEVV